MGSAPFAVGFLSDLIENGYNVALVVAPPDKPAGRGRKLKASPVKELAEALNIPVAQPESLKDPQFIHTLQELQPALAIVVAFRMLPQEVWSLPTYGTVNIHASLLPKWRGAAPINHAIMSGDLSTGVTLFQLQKELDAGAVIDTRETPIEPNENFESLHDRLAILGRELLLSNLPQLMQGTAHMHEQPNSNEITYAHKLTKENTQIDWSKPACTIHNFVRGLAPTPSAWTNMHLQGKEPTTCKLLQTTLCTEKKSHLQPGALVLEGKKKLFIVCGDASLLQIDILQPAGKKPLKVNEFLNGTKIQEGDCCK